MKKYTPIVLPMALSVAFAAPAFAQDEEGGGDIVTLSGFVDTSVFMPLSGYDSEVWTFGVDQVELDVTVEPGDGLTLQMDINAFPQNGTPITGDSLIEQGYLDYELDSGFFFRAGKANAPIGAETVDPTGLYQYSVGQIFGIIASNLSGAFMGYRGDTIAAQVWATNDWDTPGGVEKPIIGGRFDYMFSSGHVGLSFTQGPIGNDAYDGYTMVDVDTAVEVSDLTILGEVHFGTGQSPVHPAEETTNIGALLTLSYAINDWVAATVRGDVLSTTIGDADALTSISATGAGLFSITDNYGVVAEIRADIPDSDTDLDTAVSGALEFLAWW